MKKFAKMFLVTSLLLSGCTKEESRMIQDGTYTSTADGYNGEITAEVTFTDGSISKIEVIDENEPKTWADSALEKIPDRILNEQSVNVDVVTGATVTSNAIMSALKDAVEQAGGNINEWNSDTTGTYETEEETIETEVVIVGGGVSGMTAALRLRQEDIDCVLVEEDDVIGGTLLYGGHYSQVVSGSDAIRNDEDITISTPKETIEDIEEYSQQTANTSLLNLFQKYIGETVDWQITDLGVVFSEDWLETSSYQKPAVKEYDQSNDAIGELLGKEVEVSGTEVLTDTIMMKMETDGSKVTGIQAINSDGTIYHIYAEQVVIATGSSFNTEGLSVGISSQILKIMDMTDTESSDIQTSLAFAIDETHAIDTYDANQDAMESGLIIVNEEGERFVNETISRNDLSDACEEKSYLVMSGSAYAKWKESMIANGQLNVEQEESFDEHVYHGETLLDACTESSLPFEQLSKTLKLFNAEVKNDASDIYLREELGSPIDLENDVYIIPLQKASYAGNGGLEVDDSLHLINGSEVIENVYVVGNAVGNVFGTRLAEGLTNAWAFVSGKYVADRLIGIHNG